MKSQSVVLSSESLISKNLFAKITCHVRSQMPQSEKTTLADKSSISARISSTTLKRKFQTDSSFITR